MALFFEKLPGEIRNQVYRELLLDDSKPVEPQGKSFDEITPVKRLHPNILRVCKRTEKEALPILYQENVFRFDYRWPCYTYGGNTLFSPGIHLSKGWKDMKKVIVAFREKKQQHLCEEAKEIMVMFKFFNKLGCSFDTLYLALTFDGTDNDDADESFNVFMEQGSSQSNLRAAVRISSSETFLNAVSQLDVKSKIEMLISSNHENDHGLFDLFAYRVGSDKQWAICMRAEEQQPKTVDKEEQSYHKNEKNNHTDGIEVDHHVIEEEDHMMQDMVDDGKSKENNNKIEDREDSDASVDDDYESEDSESDEEISTCNQYKEYAPELCWGQEEDGFYSDTEEFEVDETSEESILRKHALNYARYAYRNPDYEGDDQSKRPRYAWTWKLKPATTILEEDKC